MEIGDYVRVDPSTIMNGLHYQNGDGILGKVVQIKHDMVLFRKEYLIEFWDNTRKWYPLHLLKRDESYGKNN